MDYRLLPVGRVAVLRENPTYVPPHGCSRLLFPIPVHRRLGPYDIHQLLVDPLVDVIAEFHH